MNRSVAFRLLVCCCLLATLFTACSRDPNVRKQKYFDSGEKYFAAGKYREAAIQYSNAVQIDPNFAQAHYKLSQAFLQLGERSRAFRELSRAVELDPTNFKALTDLANILDTVRNPDGSPVPEALKQAKDALDKLNAANPNAPETHEAWANYYGAQNKLTDAVREAQLSIDADPGRSESWLLLGLLQMRSNLPDKAEQSFLKATQLDPKAMNAQLALGGFYQSHNRLPDAEQQFKHAIEIEPKSPAPRAALVRLLMQEGKRDETEAFLRQTKKDLADNPEGYHMLGDFYFATGDLDKAVAEYTSICTDHPKDIQAKKNYIQLLILKRRLDEASKLNDEILKSNPHDIEGLVYKGQIQLAHNDPAGAVDSLQTALQGDSDNAVAHYQLGVAYARQGNTNQADSEWRKAVSLRPDLTDAQRDLAILDLSRGQIDEALQAAQQMITAQPYAAQGYVVKAVAELARQKYADAEQDAQEAIKLAPQNPTPYVQFAAVQFAQKHFPQAENYYQQALDKDPSSSDGLQGLMNTYMAEKQPDKAITAVNAQIAKSPNNSNFYDLLGTALYDIKKDNPGAEAALQKAIQLDKNNTDAVEKLGKVLNETGSRDQAIALYLQSIKDNPRQLRLYILAGELYEANKDFDHAKDLYQQALSISPDNPVASNNLAYVILQQGGNVDVALNMAQTARRGMPDNPNAADTLGWAYYQKGIYPSAISQFQEAIRLREKLGASDDGEIHYHLGLAYQKANQLALARQQLEKAVKLSPNNADARKALSELHS